MFEYKLINLERRLLKLECLLAEAKKEKSTGLFSRNIDEIKAALDAGENINQKNDKGFTPLTYTINSSDKDYSDVIAYLLQHGADIYKNYYGQWDAFYYACKLKNEPAMKAILANDVNNTITNPSYIMRQAQGSQSDYVPKDSELIRLAASKEKQEFNSLVHSFYYDAYYRKRISLDQYENLIKMIVDNSSEFNSVDDVTSMKYELSDGIMNTFKCIVDKYNVIPTISIDTRVISKETATELLKYYKDAAEGKIKIIFNIQYFMETCRDLCKITGDSTEFLDHMFTPKFLLEFSENELLDLLENAAHTKNKAIIQSMINAGLKFDIDDIIRDIRYYGMSRLLVKLINKNSISELDDLDLDNLITGVIESKDEYLILYFIEEGFSDELYRQCTDEDYYLAGKPSAKYCLEILNDYGAISNANDDNTLINKLLRAIKYDLWNRALEKAVTDNPDILRNDLVLDAIENNNTTTSRQLKRKIASTQKEDIYDM
jgi:hypothetical protein